MIDFSKYQDSANSAQPVEEGTALPLPSGEYKVVIEKIEPQVSKSGKDMLKFSMSITTTNFENRKLWKYQVISEDSMSYLKYNLKLLRLWPNDNDISKLGHIIENASSIKAIVSVDSGKNPDFPEVKFLEYLGCEPGFNETETYTRNSDSDVPF